MIYALIGIVLSMLLLPITTALDVSLPVWIAISAYIIWMVLSGKRGYSFIFIAIALCEMSVTNDKLDFVMVSYIFRYFYYFLLFFPPIIYLIQFLRKSPRHIVKLPIVVISIFIILGLIYGRQLSELVYIVVVTFIAFGISYSDPVDLKSSFCLFSVIILISTMYAGLEYHLGISPYSAVYFSSGNYLQGESIRRAAGLLGNPLLVLSICIFYQAFICSFALEIGKFPILPQILCLYLFSIVVSRTAVFAIVIFIFLYLCFSSKKVFFKSWGKFAILGAIIILAASSILQDSFNDLTYRFANSDQLHRVSSIGTTWNIFKSNFFGIGFDNFANKIENYAAYGKEAHINTLDNFYLTQIAHYGILGFFVIFFYVYYIVRFFRFRFRRSKWKEFFLLVTAYFIISVCFDFEAYFQILFVMYALIGGAYFRVNASVYRRRLRMIKSV